MLGQECNWSRVLCIWTVEVYDCTTDQELAGAAAYAPGRGTLNGVKWRRGRYLESVTWSRKFHLLEEHSSPNLTQIRYETSSLRQVTQQQQQQDDEYRYAISSWSKRTHFVTSWLTTVQGVSGLWVNPMTVHGGLRRLPTVGFRSHVCNSKSL